MLGTTLRKAREAAGLRQDEVAARAGLSRMTVQRIEAGRIDPRMSTVVVLARALGLEPMLVPTALRFALEQFVESGGRALAQPAGIVAPRSIVDTLDDARRRRR